MGISRYHSFGRREEAAKVKKSSMGAQKRTRTESVPEM
jgi:hypothetical protein